jgi:hypothetical protein
MDIELFKVQQFPEITENAVDQFGRLTEFSRVELLLQRRLLFGISFRSPYPKKRSMLCILANHTPTRNRRKLRIAYKMCFGLYGFPVDTSSGRQNKKRGAI